MVLTDYQFKQVLDKMYETRSLSKSLKSFGILPKDFFQYINANPIRENEYMHTQAAIAELMAEDIMDIADEEIDAMRARNRIDARKWYASKTKPQKFGDRLDLNVNETVNIGKALEEARSRTRQVIDITPQLVNSSTGLEPVDHIKSGNAGKKSSDDIFD